ncbi:MAG: helix-turn-helix transcriptional regulator [Bacteroidales bacterium]|nr:MAG: helix-turn-helix transcriptional regulator [Bacteroidales bacterium]
MSQEALAREIGVSRQTIISIEKSRYIPSTLLAFKIARFFGKSVEDVFFVANNDT